MMTVFTHIKGIFIYLCYMDATNLLEQSLTKKFKSYDDLIDFLELKMVENLDMVELPVNHRVVNGIYTREAFAPKETLLTSMKHKTDHQFIISQGSALVFTDGFGWERIDAPFIGDTKAGTRRLMYILEDIVWTSIHATQETDIKKIEMNLVEFDNKLLTQEVSK